MVVKALAAMKVAFGENPKMNYGEKDKMPCSRMAIGAMLREELYQALQYKEKKEQGKYLPLCAGLCVKQGLSMESGLKAITINAAQICGVADRGGSLEIGKDADIAIFSGNPMEVFTKTLYTIIDGKIVYDSQEEK